MSKGLSQQHLSIIAQSLYLANLLAVPGVSLVILWWLSVKKRSRGLARIHFIRAIQLSLLNVMLIVGLPLLYVYSSAQRGDSLMLALFYFICVHTAFVMLGMLNLTRAMAKRLPLF